ncbi:hypothetical protein Hanom_Chr16g01440031 [Helianthus anomalus]
MKKPSCIGSASRSLRWSWSKKLIDKDRDLACKDVVIAEHQRCVPESQEALGAEKQRGDSLEIDLVAERVKAKTAEEAHKVSQVALTVAVSAYVYRFRQSRIVAIG